MENKKITFEELKKTLEALKKASEASEALGFEEFLKDSLDGKKLKDEKLESLLEELE